MTTERRTPKARKVAQRQGEQQQEPEVPNYLRERQSRVKDEVWDRVYPQPASIGATTLIEGPNRFWELIQEVAEQPLLQLLIQECYGWASPQLDDEEEEADRQRYGAQFRLGQTDDVQARDEGHRQSELRLRLILAVCDLLEAAGAPRHDVRELDVEEDVGLARIMHDALSLDYATHVKAMRDFDEWQSRHDQKRLDKEIARTDEGVKERSDC